MALCEEIKLAKKAYLHLLDVLLCIFLPNHWVCKIYDHDWLKMYDSISYESVDTCTRCGLERE